MSTVRRWPVASRECRYFDLYHGVELTPQREGDNDVLSFSIEAHGYGAILRVLRRTWDAINGLMAKMKIMTARPLASYSNEWKVIPQKLVEIPPTKKLSAAPEGMIKNLRRPILLPRRRYRNRRLQRHRRRRPISLGRFAPPLPRPSSRNQNFLHRQVSGHQRPIQEISRRHEISSRRTT